MSHSLNEIEAMSKRAARGAGLSWGGLAEEAAKGTRWLSAFGFPGTEMLAELLTLNDRIPPIDVSPVSLRAEVWHAPPARRMSPLIAGGASLSDCAVRLLERGTITMENVTLPLLAVPFMGGAALRLGGVPVAAEWNGARLATDGQQLCVQGEPDALRAAQADRLVFTAPPAQMTGKREPVMRAEVCEDSWTTLGASPTGPLRLRPKKAACWGGPVPGSATTTDRPTRRKSDMTATETLSLSDIEDLAFRALVKAGTSEANARPLAVATAMTEADGVASHGLAYIPIYAQHVDCGKVDGQALPVVDQPRPAVVTVDAATGFAHSAIDLGGFEKLIPLAKEMGVAVLAVNNSYNCGVLGVHTQRLAQAGLLGGIGFTNAPASIAPSGGGAKPVVGTNPFSIAAPGADGTAELLIDQSASTMRKAR